MGFFGERKHFWPSMDFTSILWRQKSFPVIYGDRDFFPVSMDMKNLFVLICRQKTSSNITHSKFLGRYKTFPGFFGGGIPFSSSMKRKDFTSLLYKVKIYFFIKREEGKGILLSCIHRISGSLYMSIEKFNYFCRRLGWSANALNVLRGFQFSRLYCDWILQRTSNVFYAHQRRHGLQSSSGDVKINNFLTENFNELLYVHKDSQVINFS